MGILLSRYIPIPIKTRKLALVTHFVKTGKLTLDRLMELLVTNPRKRFGIELGCDFSVWDLNAEYAIDPEEFLSMGKATPLAGWKVFGRCMATVCDGKVVYKV